MRYACTLSFLSMLALASACSPSEPADSTGESAAESTGDEAAEAAGEEAAAPTIGASCAHFGASDGGFACEGDQVLFCSVLTSHTWEVAQDMFQCDEGKTCTELGGFRTACE